MTEGRRLLLVLALAAAVRLPFWTEALRTPLDGDAAIQGLMARHPFESLTLWGQPYGSPLEAWLTVPFVQVFGNTTEAVRLPGFVLGLALVALAFGLGRALHRDAALPAAVLAACPSSYMLLLSSQPPPLYPTALALGGVLLLGALRLGRRLESGASAPLGLLLWGGAAGLALWTHLMTASVVLACLAHLLACAPRGARRRLLFAVIPLALASAPVWALALGGRGAARAVGLRPSLAETLSHALGLLARLHEPLAALLGAHAPWVADSAEPLARAPLWAAAPLVLAQIGLFGLACARLRGRSDLRLLVVAAALTIAAFLVSRRADPDAIRFLTPLYLPCVALAAWAMAQALGARRGLAAAGLLAALNLAGAVPLLAAWRGADRAAAPFHLPDLLPLRGLLEGRGIAHAYASYGPAYRLTYETGESLVVSQFRNERFPEHPLPYLRRVRLASRVAWVLTPGIPSDMPAPTAFENDLRAAGGGWQLSDAGAAVVFHDFVPPFSAAALPLAAAGRAGDGDPDTGLTQTGALTLALEPPRELEAVTLGAPLGGGRMPPSFDLDVSGDGASYEVVGRRRRQRALRDLVWAGGHPQYLLEPELISVPFARRLVKSVRITPVGEAQTWSLGELLLHPRGAPAEGAGVNEYYRALLLGSGS
jgi:hypothetical protein